MLLIQWHEPVTVAIGVEIPNMGQTHARTRTSNLINVARPAILPGPANQRVSQHQSPTSHLKPSQAKGTHLLQAGSDDKGSSDNEDDFLEPHPGLHIVGQGSRYKKLTTSIRLNGVSVKFEVDTGAELSTVPLSVYHAKLPNSTMHPSSVTLRQYDGTILPTVGEIMVTVSYGQQVINGSFIIVENADTKLPLLGRDWLYQLLD